MDGVVFAKSDFPRACDTADWFDGGGKPPSTAPRIAIDSVPEVKTAILYPLWYCVRVRVKGARTERNTMKAVEVAKVAEQRFHNVMKDVGEAWGFGFSLPRAMLMGVDVRTHAEHGDGVILSPEVASHGDIYSLLETEAAREAITRFQYIGLATCGWAAPVVNGEVEVPPSQHLERRRVRLFLCASADHVGAVLRFQDDAETQVTDEADGYHGPLADAVRALFG